MLKSKTIYTLPEHRKEMQRRLNELHRKRVIHFIIKALIWIIIGGVVVLAVVNNNLI